MENNLAVNAPPFSFEVIPLPGKYLERTRTLRLDDQNNQTIERSAKGGEPLRDQLRRAAPGEEIILASFSPFRVQGPYKEFGPIFIAREARPWIGTKVPMFGQDGYFQAPVVLRAYDVNEPSPTSKTSHGRRQAPHFSAPI
jgi:hypothetical protein